MKHGRRTGAVLPSAPEETPGWRTSGAGPALLGETPDPKNSLRTPPHPVRCPALLQAGKVKRLAVTNSARAPELPVLPTVTEAGAPDLALDGLVGFFAPKDMPAQLRDRIAADVIEVGADPLVKERLNATGQLPNFAGSAEFHAAIEQQRGAWPQLPRRSALCRPNEPPHRILSTGDRLPVTKRCNHRPLILATALIWAIMRPPRFDSRLALAGE
jgi:hypothetical protein